MRRTIPSRCGCASIKRSPGELKKAAGQVRPAYHAYTLPLLYYVFVRILRLADQRSGHWWQRYLYTIVNPLHGLEDA